MACTPCGRGFHNECRKGCSKCHPKVDTTDEVSNLDESPVQPKKLNLKDAESTGRKRAARLYPIDPELPCEWQGKKNCGGGRYPVIGCYQGKQRHRHHGPVKRTTRNEAGNVHRICTPCHVHWHEMNDLHYNESDYELLPHLPTDADDAILLVNEAEWKSGVMGTRYKLASSENLNKHAED